jgi:hypothetical protein
MRLRGRSLLCLRGGRHVGLRSTHASFGAILLAPNLRSKLNIEPWMKGHSRFQPNPSARLKPVLESATMGAEKGVMAMMRVGPRYSLRRESAQPWGSRCGGRCLACRGGA